MDFSPVRSMFRAGKGKNIAMNLNTETSRLHTPEAAAKRRKSRSLTKAPCELISAARLDVGPSQEAKILDRLSQMPESCRNSYLRVMGGKAPHRVAIKAFCLECVGWLRREVTLCTAPACPLYPYRPFQESEL